MTREERQRALAVIARLEVAFREGYQSGLIDRERGITGDEMYWNWCVLQVEVREILSPEYEMTLVNKFRDKGVQAALATNRTDVARLYCEGIDSAFCFWADKVRWKVILDDSPVPKGGGVH